MQNCHPQKRGTKDPCHTGGKPCLPEFVKDKTAPTLSSKHFEQHTTAAQQQQRQQRASIIMPFLDSSRTQKTTTISSQLCHSRRLVSPACRSRSLVLSHASWSAMGRHDWRTQVFLRILKNPCVDRRLSTSRNQWARFSWASSPSWKERRVLEAVAACHLDAWA